MCVGEKIAFFLFQTGELEPPSNLDHNETGRRLRFRFGRSCSKESDSFLLGQSSSSSSTEELEDDAIKAVERLAGSLPE